MPFSIPMSDDKMTTEAKQAIVIEHENVGVGRQGTTRIQLGFDCRISQWFTWLNQP